MTLEQITYHSQLITDDPFQQGEIRYLCLQVQRDARERVERSLVERFFCWLFGTEDVT